MSTVDLPPPSVGPLSRLAPKPVKFVLNWGRRYSLWVFNFGLACCAIEFIATSMSRHDFIRLGVIPFAPGPRQADLMVVSGTVSDKMAPAVRRLYEQMPEPKYVISFGACSNCGGPYWDSYCVTKGVDQIVPVDVYVPGCPPRPEALLHGIVRLQDKIAGESLGERYSGSGAEPFTPPPPPRPLSATVLRRPVQPMPAPDDVPTLGLRTLPDEPAEQPPPEESPGGPSHRTLAFTPVEDAVPDPDPESERAAAPDDATVPVEPPAAEPREPAGEPGAASVRAEEPAGAPGDATVPVEPPPVEPQEAVAPEKPRKPERKPEKRARTQKEPKARKPERPKDRERPRRDSGEHDPSIIPGLTDGDERPADGGGDGDEGGSEAGR